MDKFPATYDPVQGKTYTLFGKSASSVHYYRKIADLANIILEKCEDIKFVLQTVRAYSGKKSILEKIAGHNENNTLISFILHLLEKYLSEYTTKVDEHLMSLPVLKLWDRRLATTKIAISPVYA